MIDFHSHILPEMDDGSQSVQESLAMIEAQSKQGIDTIIATSHFYADQRSPDEYLAKRKSAWEKLKAELPENSPKILLGAEVLYYPGISHSEELFKLCTEGTNILLLEMPFTPWPKHMAQEVLDLAEDKRYNLLMAHIERYYYLQSRDIWDDLLDIGVHMQSNAEFFIGFFNRRKALKLLKEGTIHFLGTDCHNMDSRRPQMDEAVKAIRKHLGQEVVEEIETNGRAFLKEASL